jgi:hypothetical protein
MSALFCDGINKGVMYMDGKKTVQRIFSFVLAWVIIFNYCDLEVFDWFGGATETRADDTTFAKTKWEDYKRVELYKAGWLVENKNTIADSFYVQEDELNKINIKDK